MASGGWVGAAAVVLCLAAGCGGAPENDAPTATVAAGTATGAAPSTTTTEPPTTTTTAAVTATTEQEVEQAYLRSWDVYTDAMLRLDPSRLAEAYAGDALDLRRGEIATAPHPVRVRVDHHYEIAVVNAATALVFENYLNHSVYVDRATLEPVERDPNNVLRREYVLEKEAGGWRVTRANAGS